MTSASEVVYICSSSWLLDHVIYLKPRRKNLLPNLSKLKKNTTIFTQKDNFWPFWVKISVILWISSSLTIVTFFSAWDKSCDLTANCLNRCRPTYCIYCYWSIILKYQIHRVESRPGLEWWDFKSSAGPPPMSEIENSKSANWEEQ